MGIIILGIVAAGMGIIILGIVAMGLWMIGKWDKPLHLSEWGYFWVCAGAAVESCAVLCMTAGELLGNSLLLAVVGGCLLLACVTDLMICQVYNFTWWLAGAAAVGLLWNASGTLGAGVLWEGVKSLLFFIALQFVLFCRMYGRADCYAFCLCAAVEASRGFGAAGFLLHMLAAYALLFLVQAVRGNINRKGNLKRPVPFLPYITVSFWLAAVIGRSGFMNGAG